MTSSSDVDQAYLPPIPCTRVVHPPGMSSTVSTYQGWIIAGPPPVLGWTTPCLGVDHPLSWGGPPPVLGWTTPCPGVDHPLSWGGPPPVLGWTTPCLVVLHFGRNLYGGSLHIRPFLFHFVGRSHGIAASRCSDGNSAPYSVLAFLRYVGSEFPNQN